MTRVVVIGAGIGGLACAARLAAAGCDVTVVERATHVGGKLRLVMAGDLAIDSGPTVLTMRWVFEELFAACGTTLADHLRLAPLLVLARHAWPDGGVLDLHRDPEQAVDAVGAFAGLAAARGFRAFQARARQTYEALEHAFIRAERPTMLGLTRAVGLRKTAGIAAFSTLWEALGRYFADPRLQQMFGRYATYCGASPMRAPATLMLVAHVEAQGVWVVDGGLHRLARAVAALAERQGATVRTGAEVAEVLVEGSRAAGVRLAGGERIAADAVVVNGDAAALAAGLFGARAARAVRADPARSLSAVTWSIAGVPGGLRLAHHNVVFSDNYAAEFDAIARGRLPSCPTTYICAADRGDAPAPRAVPERLLCIVNAPAIGDRPHAFQPQDIAACETAMTRLLARCNLTLGAQASCVTTPADFAALYPATGGALYGPATHGPFASFRRPGSRTSLPGLYLAGGSVHPGPGLPMAALSGARAAASVVADGVSTSRSRATAIAGGISTR